MKKKDETPPIKEILVILSILAIFLGVPIYAKTEEKPADTRVQRQEGDAADKQSGGENDDKGANTVERLNRYLCDYGATICGSAKEVTAIADKYGIDPTLLVSLFIKESSGGKACFKGYNCFGWGNYSYYSVFDAFADVAEGLSGLGPNGQNFAGKTLEEKLARYNPGNPNYGNKIVEIMKEVKR